ncbi:M23 family metallopeptidase [Synechococcus sp. PCC 7336]|uniref:M23 family metallopeptidase n=1 Tax=Synechococcus sp. PCC 7336 TaxID=195250 RepID=UPI00036966DC|nr:M23 family metallopeptidase [Synechococcus sp. PCC 7336]
MSLKSHRNSHWQRSLWQVLLALGISLALLARFAVSSAQSLPSFGLPIDCDLGQDCFILQYVDRDSGPGAVDFGCGRMTYDGHKGTDFAIPDAAAMAAGVPVVASSAGTVLRVRDGVLDRRVVSDEQRAAVSDRECGNGIVVDLGDGWETQYCHLRQGSVAVQPGDRVERGQLLGLVGMSGLASFPHVHLTVRREGRVIDPFVGVEGSEGCGGDRQSLWNVSLAYQPTGLVRAGFAPQPPELGQLWAGEFAGDRLPSDSAALVFWVQAYGVLDGDEERIQLIAPDGSIAAEKQGELRNQRIWLSFAGKRLRREGREGDRWLGQYQLVRQGEVLLDVERAIVLE